MQKFMNGIAYNRANPKTFEIPSNEEKKEISRGDYVKVGFLQDGESERMWLIVEEITDGDITGILDNDPVMTNCKRGDRFTVYVDNVLSILTRPSGKEKQ